MITGGKCPLFFQCWVQTHHGPPWQFQDGPLSTRSAVLAGDRSGSCAREEELRKKCPSTSCVQSCAYIFREFQIRTHIRYISLSLYHAREIFLAASNDLTMKLALRVCVACIWAQWTIVSIWFILMLYVFLIMSRTMHVQNYIYITHYIHTRMPTYLLPTYLQTDRQTYIHTYMYAFFSYFVSARRFVSDITRLKSAGHLSNMAHLEVREQVGGMRPPAKTSGDGLQRQIFFCHQIIRWSGYPWPAFMARISFGTWTKAWWRRLAARRLVAEMEDFIDCFGCFNIFLMFFFPPLWWKSKSQNSIEELHAIEIQQTYASDFSWSQ